MKIPASSKESSTSLRIASMGTLVLPGVQPLFGVEDHPVSLKLLQTESKMPLLLGYGKFYLHDGFSCVFFFFFLS